MNRVRRRLVNEEWLDNLITEQREKLWPNFPEEKKNEIRARLARELEELRVINKDDSYTYLPRQSGSIEWRSTRGEMGDKTAATQHEGSTGMEKLKTGTISDTAKKDEKSIFAERTKWALEVKRLSTQLLEGADKDEFLTI